MLRLDFLQLYGLALLWVVAAFVLARCAWEIGALLVEAWRRWRAK